MLFLKKTDLKWIFSFVKMIALVQAHLHCNMCPLWHSPGAMTHRQIRTVIYCMSTSQRAALRIFFRSLLAYHVFKLIFNSPYQLSLHFFPCSHSPSL